ncbi:MAG: adenosylcobinamide-GDP ribazoletransferase [Hyphomicrobiaceae bacterium]
MISDMDETAPSGDKRDLSLAKRLGGDIASAFSLLTILPVPKLNASTTPTSLGESFWVFPIVGSVVGLFGAIVLVLTTLLGLGAAAAAVFAMIAMAWVTGALHEDGLADFCDGIGGGHDRSRKLEIMRDSNLGTFGALGLIFAVGAEAALLFEVVASLGLFAAASVVIAVATAARLGIAVPYYFLSAARGDGLGRMLGPPQALPIAAAVAIAAMMIGAMLGLYGALSVLVGAGFAGGCVTLLARWHIGGFTGDVFGAAVVVAKIISLVIYIVVVSGP